MTGEQARKSKRMGRPHIYQDTISFNMKVLSRDLVERIDAKRGDMTRRAYLEYLLRSHPDLSGA